jgi:hypothetical protein
MRDENFFVLLSYAKKRPRYIHDGQQMGIWHGKIIFFSLYFLSISKGFQLSKAFHPHIWTWELGRVLGD